MSNWKENKDIKARIGIIKGYAIFLLISHSGKSFAKNQDKATKAGISALV